MLLQLSTVITIDQHMHSPPEHCFTPFKESIDTYSLPERFTFPFYYEPHPLCLLAAKELQHHLQTQTLWQHNFGLSEDKTAAIGKMFGVLLVQNEQGEIGYLSAFSGGKIAEQNLLPNFVPPVFDMLTEDSFFLSEQVEINKITAKIELLECNPKIAETEKTLKAEQATSSEQLNAHRNRMVEGRKARKALRANGSELASDELRVLKQRLSQESVIEKLQLRDLKLHWETRLNSVQQLLCVLTDEITALKIKRKALSAALQKKLFAQYRFLNVNGIEKDLNDLFIDTTRQTPPSRCG